MSEDGSYVYIEKSVLNSLGLFGSFRVCFHSENYSDSLNYELVR